MKKRYSIIIQSFTRTTSMAGFTLIEGIISVGIISSALIVGLALAYSNLNSAQANTDRVLAGHLAREGIEVIRWVRDSNWLRRQMNIDKDTVAAGTQVYNWDDFFDLWPASNASVKKNYLDVMLNNSLPASPTTPHYSLKAVPPSTSEPNELADCISFSGSAKQCRIRKTAQEQGVYYQDPGVTDRATVFYRRIILDPICYSLTGGPLSTPKVYVDVHANPTTIDMTCPGSDELVGMLATSHVMWQRAGKTLEVRIKERLYDWR